MKKKTPYDYRGLSIKTINEPRFSHLKLLLGWVAYFALYFLTENLIPLEKCNLVHSPIDDMIPFCEYFVIFYWTWFLLIAGSLAYTMFYNVEAFKKLQIYIMITQALAMLTYIIWPSVQDLRPDTFARNNIFTDIVKFIYNFDTPSGVCPSLHVAYSLAVLSVGLKDRDLSPLLKALLSLYVLMVCLSVCFIKQHSVIDIAAAIPVCLIGEIILYGKDFWLKKLKKQS